MGLLICSLTSLPSDDPIEDLDILVLFAEESIFVYVAVVGMGSILCVLSVTMRVPF